MSYDPLYVMFLYYFNVERDYFECHEVMEELWLEEGRAPVWQGLLQIAVGLYHHHNGNTGGAVKLFTQALEKLDAGEQEDQLGIDLRKLIEDSGHYLFKLRQIEQQPFEPYYLTIHIQDAWLEEELETIKRQEAE